MEKLLFFVFTVAVLILASNDVNAQRIEDRFELGIRINSNDNPFSAAFDGIYSISKGRRIHGNLGIGDGGIGVDLIHDWVFSFDGDRRLQFYPGIGGNIYFINDDIILGVVGELGLEYRFSIPLTLGIDYRPAFNIVPDADAVNNGVGVNVRYRF
ncbi:MAG: outer membrane insertion C- signal [Bacteroidota bacterium]